MGWRIYQQLGAFAPWTLHPIAVGPKSPGPPAQIRTSALTHPAPPSGCAGARDGEPCIRPWVSDCQLRPVGRSELLHVFPRCAILLGSSPQDAHPNPAEPFVTALEVGKARRYGIVIQPPIENLPQPFARLTHLSVHTADQLLLDSLQKTGHPFGNRFTAQAKSPVPGSTAVVRKARKSNVSGRPSPRLCGLLRRNAPNSISVSCQDADSAQIYRVELAVHAENVLPPLCTGNTPRNRPRSGRCCTPPPRPDVICATSEPIGPARNGDRCWPGLGNDRALRRAYLTVLPYSVYQYSGIQPLVISRITRLSRCGVPGSGLTTLGLPCQRICVCRRPRRS